MPTGESGREPVAFDATTSAFYVVAPEVVVDYRCPEVDAGAPLSADAGTPAEPDAWDGGVSDAGLAGDAGSLDAGYLDAATPAPPRCADGSEPIPVLGPVVSLVIQPRIHGGGGEAGLIMPLPARPDVAVAPLDFFESVSALSVPESYRVHETVTVVETASLGHQCTDPHYSALERAGEGEELALLESLAAAPLGLYGCSAVESDFYRPGTESRDAMVVRYGDGGTVFVERIETTDDYEVNVLSANTLDALTAWLDDNQFAHDAIDDEAFGAYVGEGRWFIALRVHPPDELRGTVGLAPLVITHRGDEIPIQHELQFDPEGGTIVTDAWVVAPTRVDAEDDSAETVFAAPRRLEGVLAGFGLGVGWLTELRIGRQQHVAMEDSRIVPASATGPVEPPRVVERSTTIEIPLPCCADSNVAPPGAGRSFTFEREYFETLGATPPEYPREWLHTSLAWEEAVCRDRSGGSWGSSGGGSSSGSSGSGAWGGSGGSGSSSRRLRGCAVAPGVRAALGWTPIFLAMLAVWMRSRRTGRDQKRAQKR